MVDAAPDRQLLDVRARWTPADHQTHRRYAFDVPKGCVQLLMHVRYAPKLLGVDDSRPLVESAIRHQSAGFADRIGEELAADWAACHGESARNLEMAIENLLTVSLSATAS